jgi:hypothetical protein
MAAGTTAVIVLFFARGGGPPNLAWGFAALTLLAGMATFWISVLNVLVHPDWIGYEWVIQGMMDPMIAPFVWLIAAVGRGNERPAPARSWGWAVAVTGLALSNELLMGGAFSAAAGGANLLAPASSAGLVDAFAQAVLSPWFFWSMAITMVALVYRFPIPRPVRRLLLAFTATSALGPLVVGAPWVGALGTTAGMGLVVGLLIRATAAPTGASPSYLRLGLGISVALLAMSAAAFVLVLAPASRFAEVPFAVVGLAAMAGELLYLVRTGLVGSVGGTPAPPSSLLRPLAGDAAR